MHFATDALDFDCSVQLNLNFFWTNIASVHAQSLPLVKMLT